MLVVSSVATLASAMRTRAWVVLWGDEGSRWSAPCGPGGAPSPAPPRRPRGARRRSRISVVLVGHAGPRVVALGHGQAPVAGSVASLSSPTTATMRVPECDTRPRWKASVRAVPAGRCPATRRTASISARRALSSRRSSASNGRRSSAHGQRLERDPHGVDLLEVVDREARDSAPAGWAGASIKALALQQAERLAQRGAAHAVALRASWDWERIVPCSRSPSRMASRRAPVHDVDAATGRAGAHARSHPGDHGVDEPSRPSISTSTVSPSCRKHWARRETHARRRPGGDDVAGDEGHQAAEKATSRRPEDLSLVWPPGSLAVDPRARMQVAQVADLVERDQRRPARREGVERLARRPLRGLELQVALADVVEGHRAGDVVQGVGRRAPLPRRPMTIASSAS